MNDKAVEIAAHAFTIALLSAVLMLIVGYADVREAKSDRAGAVRLQTPLAVVQSFAQATQAGLGTYFSTVASTRGAAEETRIRSLIVAIESARAAVDRAARRIGATGNELAVSGAVPNRIDLVANTNKLSARLYFTNLRLSEQSIGTLLPQPTLADLSLDVLARLGVAASTDPIAIAASLDWVMAANGGFDEQQLKRLQTDFLRLAERSISNDSVLLLHSSEMLWKEWLALQLDDKQIRTTRMREQLKLASSKSIQAIYDGLLDNIDKSADTALGAKRVSVKVLDISPSLKIAIFAFPYWLALLFLVTAAGLASTQRHAKDQTPPTILTLHPVNWLRLPYRSIRFLCVMFPIAVGILVAIETSSAASRAGMVFYWLGLGVAAVFAITIAKSSWRL